MHIVYFHPDKLNGYGATREDRWPKRLEEQGLDASRGYVIEKDLTVKQASERERELQLRDGYPVDDKSYEFMHNWVTRRTPESFKKVGDAKRGIEPNQFKNSELLKKKVIAYTCKRIGSPKYGFKIINKEYFKTYNSTVEAAKDLKIHQGVISNVLTGRALQNKGYTFEYAV